MNAFSPRERLLKIYGVAYALTYICIYVHTATIARRVYHVGLSRKFIIIARLIRVLLNLTLLHTLTTALKLIFVAVVLSI